jgi:hypothetical protein
MFDEANADPSWGFVSALVVEPDEEALVEVVDAGLGSGVRGGGSLPPQAAAPRRRRTNELIDIRFMKTSRNRGWAENWLLPRHKVRSATGARLPATKVPVGQYAICTLFGETRSAASGLTPTTLSVGRWLRATTAHSLPPRAVG